MQTRPTSSDLAASVAFDQTRLSLPSRPEWIEPAAEFLQERAVRCGACSPAHATKLTVALLEALSNAVVHGNLEVSSELKERADSAFAELVAARAADPHYAERTVDVAADYDGRRCRWVVTDRGRGFDVERVLCRLEEPDVTLASGRGILMMRAFLDDVHYDLGGRRVILTLNKRDDEERRKVSRVPCQERVRVAPVGADGQVDWGAAYDALAKNLSPEGMAILQTRLAAGNRILVGVDVAGQAVYLPAEVRHCRTVEGDIVELGCRFQPRSELPGTVAGDPGQGLQHAIEQFVRRVCDREAPSAGERRQHPRAPFAASISVDGRPAFARDLSRGGIAFLITQPLAPGTIDLSLPQGSGGLPLRVRAQVVRCTKLAEGFYDVGARFVALTD